MVTRRTLDAWYRTYTPQLTRALQRLPLQHHEREDIVQETWCRASRYNGTGVFSTWLTTVAQNLAIDHLRKERREVSIDAYLPLMHAPNHRPDPLVVQEGIAFMARQLNVVQARTFIMLHYSGMRAGEIAAVEGTSTSTIHARARIAEGRLRAPPMPTYPTMIALPIGYAAVGWMEHVHAGREYTIFSSEEEQTCVSIVSLSEVALQQRHSRRRGRPA